MGRRVVRPERPAVRNYPLQQVLQKITDQFAAAGTDAESPPNQSALSQLRTNEIALGLTTTPPIPLWEIREFRIDTNNGGYLRQVTAKQTPDRDFADDPANKKQLTLAAFINGAQADILAQEHHVPVEFPTGKSFLGGAAPTPPDAVWKAPGILNPGWCELFSLGTCSGCLTLAKLSPNFVPDNLSTSTSLPRTSHTFVPVRQARKHGSAPFLTGVDKAGKPDVVEDPDGTTGPVGAGREKAARVPRLE